MKFLKGFVIALIVMSILFCGGLNAGMRLKEFDDSMREREMQLRRKFDPVDKFFRRFA